MRACRALRCFTGMLQASFLISTITAAHREHAQLLIPHIPHVRVLCVLCRRCVAFSTTRRPALRPIMSSCLT